MKFDNKLAVITGGGSGIGAACARFIAERGGKVVIADRHVDNATAVAKSIGAHVVEIDVGEEASVQAAVDEVVQKHGVPDILINCAGVLQSVVPPEKLSMKEWDFVSKIDSRGTYLCCLLFGLPMTHERRGAIVNIASVSGMISGPLHSYGPAKAAVINMTECLAAEWGRTGVRVNAISPGFTRTPALEKGIAKKVMDNDVMTAGTALGRLTEATEIAAAVCFLASDMASGITGVNLPVDAGFLVTTPWASFGGIPQHVQDAG